MLANAGRDTLAVPGDITLFVHLSVMIIIGSLIFVARTV